MKANGDINGDKTSTLKFSGFMATGAKTEWFLQFVHLDPWGWNLVIPVGVSSTFSCRRLARRSGGCSEIPPTLSAMGQNLLFCSNLSAKRSEIVRICAAGAYDASASRNPCKYFWGYGVKGVAALPWCTRPEGESIYTPHVIPKKLLDRWRWR